MINMSKEKVDETHQEHRDKMMRGGREGGQEPIDAKEETLEGVLNEELSVV